MQRSTHRVNNNRGRWSTLSVDQSARCDEEQKGSKMRSQKASLVKMIKSSRGARTIQARQVDPRKNLVSQVRTMTKEAEEEIQQPWLDRDLRGQSSATTVLPTGSANDQILQF